ncbi:MAG: NRDE family protein [Planctomycetota bacterium]|jgi:uncharacterized protein with NRDE domain
MCVLICRVGPDPLLAANRDEIYARPFCAPRRWVADTPFWAPRDEEEGGSWLGINELGLMAAITNRSLLPVQPNRPSRGHLVTGVLGFGALNEAREWVERELRSAPRNAFQLFAAQGEKAFLCRGGPDGDDLKDLAAGIHVLSNLHEPDEIDFGLPPDAGWEEIRPILCDTDPRLPRGLRVCKRTDWRGTVASALIEPRRRFLFADGPPDETDYSPVPGYSS